MSEGTRHVSQFASCEETLALVGAIIVALIACKAFKASVPVSVLMGVLAAAAIAYATYFEFTLPDDMVIYRNRFRERSFPVAWVKKVGMQTVLAGLPGHTFMFVMKAPPAPVNGYFFRTGLVSWPSASRWVEEVNAEAEKASPK